MLTPAFHDRRFPPQPWQTTPSSAHPHFHMHRYGQHAVQLETQTGPLAGLASRKSVLILDVENLTLSSRQAGYELMYPRMTKLFKAATKSSQLHAVLSIEKNDTVDVEHLHSAELIVHTRNIQRHAKGKSANADNVIAFTAGLIISRSDADDVIIASGDGDLACDLAEAIHNLPRKRVVWTLSVPGATNHRLDCRRNPLIMGNIEVGLDLLTPLTQQPYRRLV